MKTRYTQGGFTLVELMIGLALGAFVVLGVLGATTGMLRGDMLAQSRLDQELRSAAFVLERELARAGYTGAAAQALRAGADGWSNPFALLDVSAPGCVRFAYDLNENGVLDTAEPDERQAFALADGVLLRRTGGEDFDCDTAHGAWEPLTDEATVTVQAFTVSVASALTPVPGTSRALAERTVAYALTGAARTGQAASRTVQASLRLPNATVVTP